jgi:hypothetical protein
MGHDTKHSFNLCTIAVDCNRKQHLIAATQAMWTLGGDCTAVSKSAADFNGSRT